jgi:hypothetical protein
LKCREERYFIAGFMTDSFHTIISSSGLVTQREEGKGLAEKSAVDFYCLLE